VQRAQDAEGARTGRPSRERHGHSRSQPRVCAGRCRGEPQRVGVHEGQSTMNTLHSTFAAALLAAAATQPTLAADDDLSKRIAACTREQDDARRLACFDRAAAPAATAPEVAAEKVDATQTFGVHGSELA